MVIPQLSLVALSLLLFGAHYLRSRNLMMLGIVAVALALLLVQQPWAARVVQLTLVLAVIEWCRTMNRIAQRRRRAGQPILRMSIILGTVAMAAAISVLAMNSASVRQLYGLG